MKETSTFSKVKKVFKSLKRKKSKNGFSKRSESTPDVNVDTHSLSAGSYSEIGTSSLCEGEEGANAIIFNPDGAICGADSGVYCTQSSILCAISAQSLYENSDGDTPIRDRNPKPKNLRPCSSSESDSTSTLVPDKSDSRSDKDISKSKEIWTPGDPRDDTGPAKIHTNDLPSFKEVPPVWTPRSASASPGTSRRSYRKLDCDVECSKKSSSHRTNQEGKPSPQAEESYAWKNRELDKIQTSSSCSSINTLPKIQSPTVTLLQKKREGHIPVKRPDYDQRDNVCKPGDKLYTIKREYESDDETGTHHKYAVLGAEKVEGVGPIANGGIPVTLKSGIKSEHQGEWYKRMFDSLHKVKDGRYGAGGYASEPEYYDSDGGTTRYVSLNRKSHKFDYDVVESHPKLFSGYLRTPNLYEWIFVRFYMQN